MYDKVCEKCGTRLSSYYQTGMLGCPECYNAFRMEILSTLKDIQRSTEHTGKKLSNGLDKELLDEYKRLLKEKELAIMEGRFSDLREISANLFDLTEELKRRGLI
ncbi:MAG: hypothetical protein IJW43_01835 [Clostridia bacterium]|nr:hypothetical protein [Clostridia bacterium]